jgi:amino acid adenylation domain-containing protein
VRQHPASAGQRRLWFLHRLAPDSTPYSTRAALRLHGPLDTAAVSSALDRAAARHEALRTTLAFAGGEVVQRVHAPATGVLRVVPLAPGAGASTTAQAEVDRPFDLAAGPLFRAALVPAGEDDAILALSLHHAVADALSLDLLLAEIGDVYSGRAAEPAVPGYADFAAAEPARTSGAAAEGLTAWWRERLRGVPGPVELPADRRRPAVMTFRASTRRLTVGRDVAAGLALLARRRGTTPFAAMLAGLAALVARRSGQRSFVIGVPAIGPRGLEFESAIGPFACALPVAFDLGDDPSFERLAARTGTAVLEALAHQEAPFDLLIQAAGAERDLSRPPLVQLTFGSRQPAEPPRFAGLGVEPVPLETVAAPFDLSLEVVAGPELDVLATYSAELYEPATVDRTLEGYAALLASAVARPDAPVSELDAMGGAERELVTAGCNRSERSYPLHLTVCDLVRDHAARHPDSVALHAGDQVVTFGELHARALGVARHLRGLGAGRGDRVCVLVPPSIEAVTAFLGVMLAGAAYVPIDAVQPPERVRLMIEDSGARAVLTIDQLRRLEAGGPDEPQGPAPEDVAYCIYTSGSTGRPKGVLVPHRALANLVAWHAETFGIGERDRCGQTAGLSFDASVKETWTTLCQGASLHVAGELTRKDPRALGRWIADESLSFCFVPTAVAERLVGGGHLAEATSLRGLSCGGEILKAAPDPARPFVLADLYGPAEAAVVTAWADVDRLTGQRPVGNVQVHIVDAELRPAPIGCRGELCLAGVALAYGYLGEPALTARHFVPNPFGDGVTNTVLYRTGDVASRRADGSVDVHGRRDDQVKVRGMRMEVGEIEAWLCEHPAVAQSVVVTAPQRGGQLMLCAHVVPAAGAAPDAAELREHLRRRLPDPMVPAAFAMHERLPLTASGKVDRGALVAAAAAAPAPAGDAEPPRSDTERAIAALWTDVLGRPSIGVREKFFDAGGTSLKLMDLQERLETLYTDAPTVSDLFQHHTVEAMARLVDRPRSPAASHHEL